MKIKRLLKFFGYALSILTVVIFVLAGLLIYITPSQCDVSKDAYKQILNVLPPDQARTLRPTATEGNPDSTCSLWFVFEKNGKQIEVGAMQDDIHGTKFSSSDEGQTARAIVARRHAR